VVLSKKAAGLSIGSMSTKAISQDPATSGNEAVADFLKRLPSLRSKKTPAAKPWQRVIGTAKGDAVDKEAARLGAEWRAKMNKSKFG